LSDQLLENISEVPEEVKEILLDADFLLTVSIGKLPKGWVEGFEPTGMKWH
jgi:hypothetical protein